MIGTREEWQVAREALLEREREVARLNDEVNRQRRELPWVPVEKEYRFTTDDGVRTLAELFDGHSQLLAYHLMFGAGFTKGACPGCSNLADHFDGGVVHLENRDVSFLAISRVPFDRLQAYKRRMGWRFRWVSSFGSDFNHDFGFAATEEELMSNPETRAIIDDPRGLGEWSETTGADAATGLAEGPGWNAFALQDGVVHHTYSRDTEGGGDLLGPYYHQLLDQTPKGRPDSFPLRRNDEY
jgi:predicted dithiol-disulfide oxidoreductase (DUF899 family)